jgi:putative peptidoglycan lipid II flippase
VLAFGQASGSQSVDLLAAALASLGLGLLPYGMFFLLARAFYVLGDSRRPAMWGAAAALVGVVIMLVAGATTSSATTVLALGLAHSVSYLLGCVALVVSLHRRTGQWVVPSALPKCAAVAAVAGVVVWGISQWWSPSGRIADLAELAVLVPLAGAIYLGGTRLLGISVSRRLPRGGAASSPEGAGA